MSQTDIKTIGFIGYGAMGVRMGANLRRAGYRLVAYTPSRKSADPQTPILESPKTVAEQSDAIILCVPNDSAQASSLLGDKGILAGIRPDTLLIDCSTVSPGAADKLAEIGRQHGIAVLDAPMSGSTPEAEKGELVMLVGGEDATLERARPILEAVSKAIVHAGPAGSGARLKLVINGIMGATLNIVAEGVGYGLSAGLDRDMLFEALSQVAVISPITNANSLPRSAGLLASVSDASHVQRYGLTDGCRARCECVHARHGGCGSGTRTGAGQSCG